MGQTLSPCDRPNGPNTKSRGIGIPLFFTKVITPAGMEPLPPGRRKRAALSARSPMYVFSCTTNRYERLPLKARTVTVPRSWPGFREGFRGAPWGEPDREVGGDGPSAVRDELLSFLNL